jgi:hypothetical protein
MRIYVVNSSKGYELCQPEDQCDFERINVLINGSERRQTWLPISMRIVREDQGERLLESDSPWLGSHALIFRRKAVDILQSLLQSNGELLPLACTDAELCIYNPSNVLSALDETASTALRFSDGRIISISRYVFYPHLLKSINIFKLSYLRVSPTFVDQRFVDSWNAAQLRGLDFRQVWEGI